MNLERQGFRTYLPRYRRERRHARRRDIIKAPLFPGSTAPAVLVAGG